MRAWDKEAFEPDELETLPVCDACGASSGLAQRQFVKSGLTVVMCPKCSLLYVNPRLRQDILWQRYSDQYFQYEYVPQHGAYNELQNYQQHAPFLLALRQFVTQAGRLFEFGAATGLFLAAARLDGWEVMGNDMSQYAADYARQTFDIPIIAGNATEVALAPGSFDAVTLWETIEHVQSPRALLRKAHELLRPGGVLALSTPNAGSAAYRLFKQRWWIVAPREHIFYFTRRSLTRLLRQEGFTVRKAWTGNVDLFYMRHTLLGRDVMPGHIRLAEARHAAPPDNSASPSAVQRALGSAWNKLRPTVERFVVPAVFAGGWGDTLYLYAVRA